MTHFAWKMRSNLETEAEPSLTTSSVVLLLLSSRPDGEIQYIFLLEKIVIFSNRSCYLPAAELRCQFSNRHDPPWASGELPRSSGSWKMSISGRILQCHLLRRGVPRRGCGPWRGAEGQVTGKIWGRQSIFHRYEGNSSNIDMFEK